MDAFNNFSKEKKFDLIVFLILIITTAIIFTLSNRITNDQTKIIEYEKYSNYSKKVQEQIKVLINNKRELTLAIALSLAEDEKLKRILKENNINKLKLKEFSTKLAKNTNLKNVWFQIIDKKGTSIYRSWVDKRGDDILNARLDIKKMIEDPKEMSTISTGKYSMTFKSMVPIYDKNEFVGIFEIITHFNSIAAQLKKEKINSIVLVDKKYKDQLTKANNDKYIGRYYVANINAQSNWINYTKQIGIETILDKKEHFIYDKNTHQLITRYYIPDIDGKPMGYIIAFKNINSINHSDIELVKTNITSYAVLLIVILAIIGYYLVSKKYNKELDNKVNIRTDELYREKVYIQTILDSNPNMILVTKDSNLISANKTFFDFFGYKDIDEFKKHNNCICEYFLTIDDEKFSKDHMIHGEAWSTYLTKNNDKNHTVTFEYKGNKYFFTINALYLTSHDEILLTMQDITELKTKDQLLHEQTKLAAMGEMIGNIAHQWRQPLSVISTASTGLLIQNSYGLLKDEELNKLCEQINENAQYLSKTIDDFKNFIKGDREKTNFLLSNEIKTLISLMTPTIKANNIQVKLNNSEQIKINGFQNELIQCLINIFNNAKDVLIGNENSERYIFIDTIQDNNHAVISLKDNGGGVPDDLIRKIFEPYFTTKHQSQGTGLGLHMTYNIITQGMNGNIQVENETYTHNDKKYKGAKFIITLPLKQIA
ncbi:MAG: ATP-binding protein [Campylobacterota bacterium]|nr:ATP-binding protein [Campylobacterota bacterium]